MGEDDSVKKQDGLKEIKEKFTAFQGKLFLSKLFDQKVQENIKKELGNELKTPFLVFMFGEKDFVLITYGSPEDYDKGNAIIASDDPEKVRKFYESMRKILI